MKFINYIKNIKWYGEPYRGSWFVVYRCVSCKKSMSWDAKMYNYGMCPHCGYKDEYACTIVKCDEGRALHIYRDFLGFYQVKVGTYIVFDE